jgi:tryptophanyl-tRNA synthetase
MSTTVGSDSGRIYLLDTEEDIVRKFGSAVTDSGKEVVSSPDKAGVTNLINIMAVATGVGAGEVESEFEGKGYGDFKRGVAEAVAGFLAPVRDAYPTIREDEAGLEQILAAGAERASAMASSTLSEVREAMGVGAPPGNRA